MQTINCRQIYILLGKLSDGYFHQYGTILLMKTKNRATWLCKWPSITWKNVPIEKWWNVQRGSPYRDRGCRQYINSPSEKYDITGMPIFVWVCIKFHQQFLRFHNHHKPIRTSTFKESRVSPDGCLMSKTSWQSSLCYFFVRTVSTPSDMFIDCHRTLADVTWINLHIYNPRYIWLFLL